MADQKDPVKTANIFFRIVFNSLFSEAKVLPMVP